MIIVIDRFEGDFAVVELPDSGTLDVPRELFPGALEGDRYIIGKDEAGTTEARERIQSKFDQLKRK